MEMMKLVNVPLVDTWSWTRSIFQQVKKQSKRWERVSYSSIVGNLMYIMICTRTDIAYAYAVEFVSCFLSNSNKKHWKLLNTY